MNIDTYDKLLTMALLQKENLNKYKTDVGATGDEIARVEAAAANLQYLKDYLTTVEADKMSVTQIKRAVYDGDEVTNFAGFPAFAPPNPLVAGLKEEFQKRNNRYKLADGYTREIGIALGIVENPENVSVGALDTSFEAHAAQSNYEAAIVVSNRGKSSMWKVFGQKANASDWFEMGSATGKSANVKAVPTVPGQPERLLLRIQLYRNNEEYGEPTDPKYVTFNP
jgi:hypothetical protein